jgi:hypothetical protein
MSRSAGRHYPKPQGRRARRKRGLLGKLFLAFSVAVLAVLTIFGFAVVDRMKTQQLDFLTAAADVARDNNLGPLVAMAENFYYGSINAPKVGGTPTLAAGFDGSTRTSSDAKPVGLVSKHPKANLKSWGPAQSPSNLPPSLISPVAPLPGEGVWMPTKIAVNGITAMYVARIRPDKIHTSMFATLAWFDPKLLAFDQIAGTKLPEGNFPHGSGRVDSKRRPFYMAGFADGYRMKDSQGGAIIHGTVVRRLVRGKATLLTYPDGSLDIMQWGFDTYRPGFSVARQNLNMMVDQGQSQVINEDQAKWGQVWYGTGSGKNYIWRSGIGLRADGTVVYVQSQALSAKSLADLMVRAGVVKGMALDMNAAFANGDMYGPYGTYGRPINPDNRNAANRFYIRSTRDFVAVFAKSPAHG